MERMIILLILEPLEGTLICLPGHLSWTGGVHLFLIC